MKVLKPSGEKGVEKLIVGIISFMLGGICGILAMAFVQAHRVFEFDERVQLWEESHAQDTRSDFIEVNKNFMSHSDKSVRIDGESKNTGKKGNEDSSCGRAD